jgi:drug/metabolite transporter (DMT)-like permease
MSPRHRRLLPWIALAVVYVVWGSTYLAIRVAVREVPPFGAGAIRFLASGVAMAGLAAIVDRRHGWPTWRQVADYSLVGVLLLSVGNVLVMWAEKTIPSGIAALIVGTTPLWLTFLDGLRPGGHRWTPALWVGTLVGLGGVALVARPEGGIQAGHWGAILALQIGTISWAVGSLYAQSVPARLPVFTAAAIEMLAGSAVLLFESLVLFRDDWGAFRVASANTWLSLGYLALFGSLIGFTAFAYALNELPATTVGTYAYVNPVVAVILGRVFLKEALTPGLLAGGVLILVSVLLTTRARRARPAPVRGDPSPLTVAENA